MAPSLCHPSIAFVLQTFKLPPFFSSRSIFCFDDSVCPRRWNQHDGASKETCLSSPPLPYKSMNLSSVLLLPSHLLSFSSVLISLPLSFPLSLLFHLPLYLSSSHLLHPRPHHFTLLFFFLFLFLFSWHNLFPSCFLLFTSFTLFPLPWYFPAPLLSLLPFISSFP